MASSLDSLLAFEIGRALAEMQDNTGNEVFTWKGNDYPCTFTQTDDGYLNSGGIIPMDALTLTVHASDLPAPGPTRLDRVTFKGQDFRIQIIKNSPGGSVQYICWDPNRGS